MSRPARPAETWDQPLLGPVPRTLVVERTVAPGEALYLTPLSDLHLESSACEVGELRALLTERARLPNHSAVLIGDTLDCIGHGDRRYRPSTQARRLHGVDSWMTEGIERAVEILSVPGMVYDLVGVGNHEDSYLQHSGGFDPLSVLAQRLGCARGGYSGVIDYRITLKVSAHNDRQLKRTRVRVLYHHGAWGGEYAKGYLGAMRWAQQWDDWRVFVYGHDHKSVHHPEVRVRVRPDGTVEEYDTHIVNLSSFTGGYATDAREVRYPERKGLRRQPRIAPLITIRPVRTTHRQRETLRTRVGVTLEGA